MAVLVFLFAAGCSRGGGTSEPIEGGEPAELKVGAAKLRLIKSLHSILAGTEVASLCQYSAFCQGDAAKTDSCKVMKTMTTVDDAHGCRRFIELTARPMLNALTGADGLPAVSIRLVESAIVVNGSPKTGRTPGGRSGDVELHRASVQRLSLMDVIAALYHELGHKVPFLGVLLTLANEMQLNRYAAAFAMYADKYSGPKPGSLDETFGTQGIARLAELGAIDPGKQAGFLASAVQNDGKIVATGYTGNLQSAGKLFVVRLNADGTLDTDFNPDTATGGPGKYVYDGGAGPDSARAIALQPDGKILIGGSTQRLDEDTFTGHKSADLIVIRLNRDGSPDRNFATDGVFKFDYLNVFQTARAMTIDSDGILVAGQTYVSDTSSQSRGLVLRLTYAGALDTRFADNGKLILTTLPFPYSGIPTGIASRADGKVLVTGYGVDGSEDYDAFVGQVHRNGTWDATFAVQPAGAPMRFGCYKFNVSAATGKSFDIVFSSDVGTDGSIVLAGHTHNGQNYDLMFAKFTSMGQPSDTFGTKGVATVSINGDDYAGQANGVAVQADGHIVAAGITEGALYLLRLTPAGVLDRNFGAAETPGITTNKLGTYDGLANSIGLTNDGKIVTCGPARDRIGASSVSTWYPACARFWQ